MCVCVSGGGVRAACLLQPLGEESKLQLAKDLGELQMVVGQGLFLLDALGPAHRSVWLWGVCVGGGDGECVCVSREKGGAAVGGGAGHVSLWMHWGPHTGARHLVVGVKAEGGGEGVIWWWWGSAGFHWMSCSPKYNVCREGSRSVGCFAVAQPTNMFERMYVWTIADRQTVHRHMLVNGGVA